MRDTKNGSWFIQDLCQVINEYSDRDDLLNMLLRVQQRVAQREAAQVHVDGETPIKQMPRFETTLMRNIKF